MKKIQLTQGKECLVCDCHYDLVASKKWHYAQGYARTNIRNGDKWKLVTMNRFIMSSPQGLDVDHINRDTLDNRCSNLRAVSRSLNKHNGNLYTSNKTGFRGVYKRPSGHFVATITVKGKRHYLGFHKTLEDAILARTKAEVNMVIY